MTAEVQRRPHLRRQMAEWPANNEPVYIQLVPLEAAQVVSAPARQQTLPATTTFLWHYVFVLSFLVTTWVLYLLLPRGFRKAYCRAQRRRHARQLTPSSDVIFWKETRSDMSSIRQPSVSTVQDSILKGVEQERRRRRREEQLSWLDDDPDSTQKASVASTTTPSPQHPAITAIPDATILQETMRRLQGRGVRLTAHGIQCDPKRVWIRLDDTNNLVWQTEVPRAVTNQSGDTSIVLVRGTQHDIRLANILYVDVGKKTSAFSRAANQTLAATTCFSLLTQTGSLDLQTNSRLERDALVCCFSVVLDKVHEHDWRRLYEASPAPTAISNISSNAFPSMTAVDI